MTVEFNVTEYVFSHGGSPRGFGSWAFSFIPACEDLSQVFWVHGSYSVAKKVAARKARAEGQRVVFVLP